MATHIVSVIGGTGLQGGGVVNALLAQGEFKVRVRRLGRRPHEGNALKDRRYASGLVPKLRLNCSRSTT